MATVQTTFPERDLITKGLKQQCALCLRQESLRNSHIVPAFNGKYLKDTSATGFLRDSENPNHRRQDLFKQKLLCSECEQIIGRIEQSFSTDSFPILQSDSFTSLAYDQSLLAFAVSISWRTLVTRYVSLVADFPMFAPKLAATMESWRRFLLGLQSKPDSEHHLFVFSGFPNSMPPDPHPKSLYYLLRGIDVTAVVGSGVLAIYAKLMRMMFYSPIIPRNPTGLTNTRIHAGAGRLISPQTLAIPGFMDFVKSRIAEAYSEPLSRNQVRVITEAILKDPERVARSESLKVRKASRRLIGQDQPSQ